MEWVTASKTVQLYIYRRSALPLTSHTQYATYIHPRAVSSVANEPRSLQLHRRMWMQKRRLICVLILTPNCSKSMKREASTWRQWLCELRISFALEKAPDILCVLIFWAVSHWCTTDDRSRTFKKTATTTLFPRLKADSDSDEKRSSDCSEQMMLIFYLEIIAYGGNCMFAARRCIARNGKISIVLTHKINMQWKHHWVCFAFAFYELITFFDCQ